MATATAVPKRVKPRSTGCQPVIDPSQLEPTKRRDKPLATSEKIELIDLSKIDPHPDNRKIDPSTLDGLMQSLIEFGQLEPARVRAMPNGRYQIISGERRFQAAKLSKSAKLSFLRCIVVKEDDVDALTGLVVANSNRQDLDPVQRAQAMQRLIDNGLDRLAAGRAVGLQSESGVKNALRVLKLPKSIQAMLSAGELSERAARRLIPLCELPGVLKEIEAELKDQRNRDDLADFSNYPWFMACVIEKMTRPMDDRDYTTNKLVPGRYVHLPKQFSDTDAKAAGIKTVEIEVDSEKWLVTEDVAAWDRLQKPLAIAWVEKQDKKSTSKSTAKAASKKATPQEQAAEADRLAKEAKERLAKWTETWKLAALRCQLAHQVTIQQARSTLPLVFANFQGHGTHSYNAILRHAMLVCSVPTKRVKDDYRSIETLDSLPDVKAEELLTLTIWRYMIWPVSDSEESVEASRTPAVMDRNTIPDIETVNRSMPDSMIKSLSKLMDATISNFWQEATTPGKQQTLLGCWLRRQTVAQLVLLWDELKPKGGKPLKAVKRDEIVHEILNAHFNNPLQLPRSIR